MRALTLVIVVVALVSPSQEQATGPTALAGEETYAALWAAEFDAAGAREVENIELSRGPATLVLRQGTWVPLEPIDGRVHGGVFVGSGRLRYTPPSGVEQDQLERFTDRRALDETFERLYLRFSDGAEDDLAAPGRDVVGESSTSARLPTQTADRRVVEEARRLHLDVRRHFLEEEQVNLEARLLAELADDRSELFFAWIDTRDGGPLHFAQDGDADDLFTLRGWAQRYDVFDIWGGFGAVREPAARPIHYVVDVTLSADDLEQARVELQLVARRSTRVLRFAAHPLLQIAEVLDAEGNPLFFVRETSKDDEFEGALTVVLPHPLVPGRPTTLTFVYAGDIIDTVYGGGEYALKAAAGWYPVLGYMQRATYEMTFRVDRDDEVFASASRISDEVVGERRVARFEQKHPVAMVSFNYGSMPTRVVEIDGVPPITVFGTASGLGGDALGNVAADVGNSLRLFIEMFGDYPFDYMAATRIPYARGQGFPGLLHLAAATFGNERRGSSEAFRGHETAHQWWGHIVGWKTYRDQWLSEGFAEYSGALYAEAYLNDPRVLDSLTDAWRNDVFGKGNAGFRSFGMPSGTMQRRSQGSWAGPVTLGYRLSSSATPVDYAMLAYEKGAYILHMLRMAMYDWTTGSDEAWRVMMRDFVASHAGGAATTESFRGTVEKHFGEDMGWFFDQWVYGTAVPTYRYAWKVETAFDGHRSLRLRVRQGVEPDVPFRMFVPVRVELADDRFVVLRVLVDEPYEEFRFDLPGGVDPDEVILNPRNAVLAEVQEEGW